MTDRTDSNTRLTGRQRVCCGCVLAVIALLVTAPVAATAGTAQPTNSASQLPAEPAFVVNLDADGSARVTLTVTFDLTTDSEREAFETFRENTTARERRTDRFAARLRAIAAETGNATDRTMEVREPDITFVTRNDTGIVALSATWVGLASQEDDRLALREPFTSGFTLNRTFRVIGPDGYELATAHPSPTTQTQTGATWRAGMDLDGFEATFTPAESTHTAESARMTDTETDESSDSTPGFGIGLGALAVAMSTALLLYRR